MEGWNYKRTLTDGNSTAVTDFQIQVSLTSANFDFSHAESDGSDIRLYDETDSMRIPYWIESYDSEAQTAVIHVRVRDMSHEHSIYYGNASATPFRIPPIGPWVKRSAAVVSGGTGHLAEGLVIDDDGTPYITSSAYAGGELDLWVGSSQDPWTATFSYYGSIGEITGNGCLIIKKGSDGSWYAIHGHKAVDHLEVYIRKSSSLTSGWGAGVKVVSYNQTTWDQESADEPYFWEKPDGKWGMVYMANDSPAPHDIETIFYAESDTTDPQGTWTLHGTTPVWGFGGAQNNGLWYSGTVADPFRWKVNETDTEEYLFASVAATYSTKPWTIGYAVVADDSYDTVTPMNVMLANGAIDSFDDTDAHRGSIMLHSDDYYYLIYTGHDGSTYNGGMARMYSYSTAKGYPPEQVFDFYVDFSNNTLVDHFVRKGGSGGAVSASSGKLNLVSGTGTLSILQSPQNFRPGFQMEAKVKHASANGTNAHAGEIGFGLLSGTNGMIGTGLGGDNIRIYTFNSTKYIKLVSNNATVSQSDMGQNYSTNDVIHRIKWASATSVLFSNDGEADEEITTNIPDVDLSVFAMAYASAGNDTTFNIYYIKVRKYAATEPSVSVGSEQNLNESAPATVTRKSTVDMSKRATVDITRRTIIN